MPRHFYEKTIIFQSESLLQLMCFIMVMFLTPHTYANNEAEYLSYANKLKAQLAPVCFIVKIHVTCHYMGSANFM